jgi:hypothetical protein
MDDQWNHMMATVNGINIHYVIEGRGKPVVLLRWTRLFEQQWS